MHQTFLTLKKSFYLNSPYIEAPKIDPSELTELREQINKKQHTIDELRSDNEEMEKDWKRKFHQLEADMKNLRNEKNELSMVKFQNYLFIFFNFLSFSGKLN